MLAAAGTLAAQDPVKPLDPPATQELPPGIRWRIALPAPPAAAPVIHGERIFLSALPGLVAAYHLADGRELWREALSPDQPLAVDADRVYVAADESVHAVGITDGARAWRRSTGAITAPLLAKEGWLIAASATTLFALRASDGEVIWSRESGPQRQRAAISGDLLVVPLASGALHAMDLRTGADRWVLRLAGAPVEPLIVGDRLYAGVSDKRFYCVDIRTGDIDWDATVGALVRGQAATDGERVFYVALDNLVRARSLGSGSQRWQHGVPFRPFSGPQVIGLSVVVAGPTTDVRLLNVRDGRETGKITFPEALHVAPAFGTLGDAVVAAGVSGGLSAEWKLWLATPAMAAAAK